MFGPLRPSRAPLAAPPGALAAHSPLGRRQAAATEAPRNSPCLPALAHTGRLALAGRAGMRTRAPRDAAVAHLRVAEGAPGDLAGALALTRARRPRLRPSPRPSRRARRAAPGLEGPIATRQPAPEGRGSERTSSRLACAPPARVGVAELVVWPDQGVRLAGVGHACGREGRAADVAAAGVLPRVAPRAEVPLVAPLGQARLGVARA